MDTATSEIDFRQSAPALSTAVPWKVLIADDEPEVHDITRLVLGGFEFEGRPLEFLRATSGAETRQLLAVHSDVAVMLLDVVMETEHAGLDVVRFVRDQLHNHRTRIVLRTGQPGQAPEHEIIAEYDINDYKEKTKLTAQKLATTLFAALRGYRDIMIIEANKRGLERVIEASSYIFSHEKPAEFASAVLAQLGNLVGLNRGALYLKSSGPGGNGVDKLVIAAGTGDFADLAEQPVSRTLPPHVMQSVRIAFANKQHLFTRDHYVLHFTDSHQTESLLYVAEACDLSPLDYRLVEVFCTNVSIAFENLHLNRELFDAQLEMIWLLAGAAESRSSETAAHVRRVGVLAEFLGRHHGLDTKTCESLRFAAPLHDVGKIAIPDAILNKPGPHTEEESLTMRTHAQAGHEMLSVSTRQMLKLAAEIAISHHENWDGSGYPGGLAGEAIPLSGRITMVADVFDALGSRRCYKEPWAPEAIRAYMIEQRGIKFDPALVDLLLANWSEAESLREQMPD